MPLIISTVNALILPFSFILSSVNDETRLVKYLLPGQEQDILQSLCSQEVRNAIYTLLPWRKFDLLYRVSRDGWRSADFHRLCDRQGPTIVVLNFKRWLHLWRLCTAVLDIKEWVCRGPGRLPLFREATWWAPYTDQDRIETRERCGASPLRSFLQWTHFWVRSWDLCCLRSKRCH